MTEPTISNDHAGRSPASVVIRLLFSVASDPHAHNYVPVWFHSEAMGKCNRGKIPQADMRRRNTEIVRDVLSGKTYREAARRNGLGDAERVRQIVMRFCCRTIPSVSWTNGRLAREIGRNRGWLLRALRAHAG
jgi:hypothetical protein